MFRVRQVLSALAAPERAALKKLLPAGTTLPADLSTLPYPAAVLSCFSKADCYAQLGLLAEGLLRLPAASIQLPALLQLIRAQAPGQTLGALQKVRAAAATSTFLAALAATRGLMDAATPAGQTLLYDQVVGATGGSSVVGHPDARTATHLFEVKLTGLPERGWADFLLQLFAYGALAAEATHCVLVLPLQQRVVTWDITAWAGRAEYRRGLEAAAVRLARGALTDALVGEAIRAEWRIGSHVRKLKTLRDTVAGLPDYERPWQIFLGNPQSSKLAVTDADVASAAAMVAATGARLYVHSQYIINLCAPVAAADAWATAALVRNVEVARAAGCRGVVVHVGKSTTQALPVALEAMRVALRTAMAAASAECPILLETPAGQGTETLKGMDEFLSFVRSFADERLRVCLDTCHVFACGHRPLEYLERAVAAEPGLLKLVHYNDSAAACGSCVDRHAFMGTGHIGMDGMRAIAEFCGGRGVPMVIE